MAMRDEASRMGGARLVVAARALALLAGCAGNRVRVSGVGGPRLDYQPPGATPAGPVSVDVAEAPAEALAAVEGTMRANGLRVTLVDPRAFLVIGQYEGDPQPFVDCGAIEVLPGAKASEPPSRFPAAVPQAQVPRTIGDTRTQVVRSMRLDGRLVVTAAPSDAGTRLTSRAYYVITLSFALPGELADAHVGPRVEVMSFTSDRAGSLPAGTTCVPTGRLERLALPPSAPRILTPQPQPST
jgi:hypothetical protein